MMFQKMTTRTLIRTLAIATALTAAAGLAAAQDAPTQAGGQRQHGQFGGQFAGMQRAGGEVTAVSGGTLTIKTEAGETMQIVTTDNTRVMKGRRDEGGGASGNAVKVSDLKVGDGVMAVGNLDAPNKTLHAALIMATDAAVLAKMKADLGKTYIVGKVTAIDMDNAKMTVQRSDGVSQTIGFDETTSFRRGRVNLQMMGEGGGERRRAGGGAAATGENAESITLADIKVGDNVAGRGSVKGGVFVPTELVVGTPGERRQRPAAPAAGTASPTQPQ